jgi:Putative transposase/Transposase zinc-binding domain
MGGHVSQCQDCGNQEISYNSCRNRHCPRCQFLARARWLEAREGDLLPVPYFHSVFTLPHVLNPLILCNPKPLYDLLFRSASETLKEVGTRHLKGASLGFIAVLHTWGQNLMHHPHLHVIVPGGGLSADHASWKKTPENYLLPIKVLSDVFRGKFLSALEKMRTDLKYPGSIESLQDAGKFKHLLREAAAQPWIVYTKRPFAGPKQVLNYLGNYTHRIAISNYRLLALEKDHVRFRYRDYRDGGKTKEMELHAKEFMRRFLLHVLPSRFVRIRHYGMLGSRVKKKALEKARTILGAPVKIEANATLPATSDWKEWFKQKTGIDVTRCRKCKDGLMTELRVFERWPWRRRCTARPLGLRTRAWGGFDTS